MLEFLYVVFVILVILCGAVVVWCVTCAVVVSCMCLY